MTEFHNNLEVRLTALDGRLTSLERWRDEAGKEFENVNAILSSLVADRAFLKGAAWAIGIMWAIAVVLLGFILGRSPSDGEHARAQHPQTQQSYDPYTSQ